MTTLPELAHLPVCPHRRLPVPFIAEIGADGTGHFTVLDGRRAVECFRGRLCAMCGLPMGDEVTFVGDLASLEPGSFWIEPPVHERCAELAVGGLCPYLSRERVPRRVPDADVAIVGTTAAELADVGRATRKRPLILAVARAYTVGLVPSTGGDPVAAYIITGRPERTRLFTYGADGLLAEAAR